MSSIFIYGIHSVTHALQYHPENILEIWLIRNSVHPGIRRIDSYAHKQGIHVSVCDNKLLIDKVGPSHQGVMARRRPLVPLPEHQLEVFNGQINKQLLLLALDGIQDPHNFGACLRVAAGAGVDAVITPRKLSVPINASVHKASSGTAEWVTWIQVGNMVRQLRKLKSQGIWIIGTDQKADPCLFDVDLTGSILLLMGSEGQGLRQLRKQTCDHLVHIPMDSKVESLNVSVATGICLYHALQQRRHVNVEDRK